MIVVAIIAVLATIAVPKFELMVKRSDEASTLGNLASLRSALSIYYTDQQTYPTDNLTSLGSDSKYLSVTPWVKTPNYHPDSTGVMAETVPSDTGLWSYDNSGDPQWGEIHVGCTHLDTRGNVWSDY